MLRTTLCILLLAPPCLCHAQEASPAAAHAREHAVARFEDLAWRAAGPQLEIAIAEGDPKAAGRPFTMMLRLQAGSWINPHWHNVTKRLVVVFGELRMGIGDTVDSTQVMTLRPGGVAVVPEGQHHYEGALGQTVIALHAIGPFQTTFVGETR